MGFMIVLSALKVDLNDTIHLNTVRVVNKLFCVYAYRLTFCTYLYKTVELLHFNSFLYFVYFVTFKLVFIVYLGAQLVVVVVMPPHCVAR